MDPWFSFFLGIFVGVAGLLVIAAATRADRNATARGPASNGYRPTASARPEGEPPMPKKPGGQTDAARIISIVRGAMAQGTLDSELTIRLIVIEDEREAIRRKLGKIG